MFDRIALREARCGTEVPHEEPPQPGGRSPPSPVTDSSKPKEEPQSESG